MSVYSLASLQSNRSTVLSGSFAHLTKDEIETHLKIDKYGNFRLPSAIRPSYDLQVVPTEGYRYETYFDSDTGLQMPVLICSVSENRLFDVFYDLVSCFCNQTKIVLESTHFRKGNVVCKRTYQRSWIDIPVFLSTLVSYEELLLSDGCMGISIVHPELLNEVQLDEHKLLYIYGTHWNRFLEVLNDNKISYVSDMSFLTDAEHVHLTNAEYWKQFQKLCEELEATESH